MILLSECIGIPVIAKGDGRLIGRIKNVYFDKIRRVFAYFCIDAVEGGTLFLPVSAVTPRQAILLDDNSLPLPKDDIDVASLVPALLSLAAYTLNGASRGVVTDAKFSADGTLTKLILSDGEISPSQIACVGDVVLVKNARPLRRIPRPKTDYPVHILQSEAPPIADDAQDAKANPEADDAQNSEGTSDVSDTQDAENSDAVVIHYDSENSGASSRENAASENAPPVVAFAYAPPLPAIAAGKGEPMFSAGALSVVLDGDAYVPSHDAHNPTRIICDYDFLLGRTLGADLTTYTGELLAPKGAIITASVVELARAHGKLVDLTLNSVKRTR